MRTLAGTDLAVSPLCLGTMTFGRPVAEPEAIRLVHWALDHGLNFFDTADMYEGYDRTAGSAGGVAEEILGTALQGKRDKAVITTKVGNAIGGADYTGNGLSRAHILHQAEASLRRLQTDRIDLYLLHRPDPATPLSESIETMKELIAAGMIRQWGFSNFEPAQINEMLAICSAFGWPPPVVSQPAYSWLKREVAIAHLPLCRELNIAVTPYQPLQGGLLTGKYVPDQQAPVGSRLAANPAWLPVPDYATYERLQVFAEEADQAGLSPAGYAIRWLLDQPGVTSVVVGARTIDQLNDLHTGTQRPDSPKS